MKKRHLKQFTPEGKHSIAVSSTHSPWQEVLSQYSPLTHNQCTEQQELGRASLVIESAFFQNRVACPFTRDKTEKS